LGGYNEGVGLVAYSSSSEEEEEKGGEAGEGGTQGGEGGGGESKSSTRTSRERKLRDSGATKGLTKNNPPTGDIADSPPLCKRQRLDHEDHHLTEQSSPLPLPPSLLSLFQDQEHCAVDDAGCHDGRARSFPHVRGQWATHVFIPFEFSKSFVSCINDLQQYLKTTSVPEGSVTIHQFPASELHLSLSRTVPIPFHVISPLTQALRDCISTHHRFEVSFSHLSWYSNEEKTRSFLSWDVSTGHNQVSLHLFICGDFIYFTLLLQYYTHLRR
ncbi:U6 snRNA phosphodiesterase, partial [Geodia barretti]